MNKHNQTINSSYDQFTNQQLSMMAQRAKVNNDISKYYHIKGVIAWRYREVERDAYKHYKEQER